MCTYLYNPTTGDIVQTMGDLRALIAPYKPVPNRNDSVEDDRDDRCLCDVDMAETMMEAGYAVWRELGADPMELCFSRPPERSLEMAKG